MGVIEVENMEFHAFHGHFEEEQLVGNTFIVNVTLKGDLSKAADTDRLDDAYDYQLVHRVVKQEMETPSHLLEHVVKRIIDRLYAEFSTAELIKVKLSKLNPPLGGQTDRVSVSMER